MERGSAGPPCVGKGTSSCISTDRARIGHAIWFGPGPATNRVPFAWPSCRGTYRCKVSLPHQFLAMTPRIDRRRGAGGGISCAEGDSGPPRDGCEPSWARPCEASGALLLSNGGSGGGHETCTLWPPPAPFGYFPARGKYLVRPQAGETFHKKQISYGGQGKEPLLSFPVSQELSPLRRRPKGFPVALWKPSGPTLLKRMGTTKK